MANLNRVSIAVLAGVALLSAGCAKLKSRDEMNKGVQAYRNNKYAEAVKHFQEAVRNDPSNRNAELYLATSYMIQWVPGADNPDNKKNFDMAQRTFQQVLNRDPKNSLALASMASMAYNEATSGTPEEKNAALEDAKKWNQRRIEADAKDPEPYYYLGVIDWAQAFPIIQTARVDEHMRADDPGPLKDAKARADLRDRFEKTLDEGIDNLKKCLALDKENDNAMTYMNLLLRKKADLEDTPEQAKADIAQAEDWFNKSMDMKKLKASRPQKNTQAS